MPQAGGDVLEGRTWQSLTEGAPPCTCNPAAAAVHATVAEDLESGGVAHHRRVVDAGAAAGLDLLAQGEPRKILLRM